MALPFWNWGSTLWTVNGALPILRAENNVLLSKGTHSIEFGHFTYGDTEFPRAY